MYNNMEKTISSKLVKLLSDTKRPAYGGQAVVEGVMFAGKKVYTTAIRRKDHSIEHFDLEKTEKENAGAGSGV
jgi:uncharacterized protein YqhQ